MQLAFLYRPVRDLKEARRFYRDALGWPEAWREGETTTAFALLATAVQLLLDQDDREPLRAGGFFRVDSVDAFYAAHRDRLRFVAPPRDIPPGRYAAVEDPSGNVLRIYDATREA
jgi:catechol 2,3-dioxygenase-like lactoylglutathione lyase family enzyme